MEIFYLMGNGKLIDFNTELVNEDYKRIDVKNIDDFYEKIKVVDLDEELEEKLIEYFADDKKQDIDLYNIKHWVSNRSFGELIDMYDSGEIKKPEMQRQFIWDSLRCSRLIESIVLGLPIPPLFLLEVESNKYEIIDGFQRLNTLYNYIMGYSWSYDSKVNRKNIASKLSSTNILRELQGKKFSDLSEEFQRKIKRSTIPLIEFKQLTPNNNDSKFLIFERINTGSEKLNSMQIRKSLSFGLFMENLYDYANSNKSLLKLFSSNSIKKDNHVEAYLRILSMKDIYLEKFTIKNEGIKYILNDYCEKMRDKVILVSQDNEISEALEYFYSVFGNATSAFKKTSHISDQLIFSGNLNVSIMEALICTYIINRDSIIISNLQLLQNYRIILNELITSSINFNEKNPFSVSTGSIESIKRRYSISKKILGLDNENL